MNIISFNSRLVRVSELPELVNSVVTIVEKHNPATLGVKPFFDLLVSQQLQIGELQARQFKHPRTVIINQNRKRRLELISAIVTQFRAVGKGKVSGMSEAALLLQPLITKHLFKYESMSSKTVTGNISTFLLRMSEKEEFAPAAALIGISVYMEELRTVQSLIIADESIRRKDKSDAKIVREKQIRHNTLKAISNLLRAIELAMVHTESVDYTTVVAELNEVLISYRSMVRSRSTANTNAINKETAASSPTTTATAS